MNMKMRKINEIIVHCTATKEGQHFTVDDVRRWHLERKFVDIGYHYLVLLDGTIQEGRPIETIGAHCVGHNAHSIRVCYVGGLDKNGKADDTRTPEQKASLLHLLTELKQHYPAVTIHGHRDFAPKACPCFDATQEYKNL